MVGRVLPPVAVDLPDPLQHFKQARPAGDPVSLEGRGYRKADRFCRPAGVRYDEIGCQRVKATLHTFDRGVK